MRTEGSGASSGRGDGIHNEDAYLVEEGLGLYVVCDGVSGKPAGEIASGTAITALEKFVEREQKGTGSSLVRTFSSSIVAGRAVRSAMRAVLKASRECEEFEGMSTTLSMLLVHGHHGAISHVGDSRVYLHRDGQVNQLTQDHDLTDDLDLPGLQEIGDSLIDTFAIDLIAGDTFLLCTDGAEQVVENAAVLGDVANTSPRVLASRIVAAAHRNSPGTDATVVVVRVREDDEPAWVWLSKRPLEFEHGHAVACG